MITARAYIKKLIRVRNRMMHEQVSQKNVCEVNEAIKRLQDWLNFWPKANEQQVRNYMRQHIDAVYIIMPGKRCTLYPKLKTELNELLYEA